MTHSFKGGRGKKAPYHTTVVRVPTPILPDVQRLITDFREDLINDYSRTDSHTISICSSDSTSLPSLKQALDLAKEVKKSKKSASYSLIKLLQLLYKDDSITQEDIK